MSKHVKTTYDAKTGRSEVVIWDKGRRYRGVAVAHEEDRDIQNQFTGLTIAQARAEIERNKSKSRACRSEIKKLQTQIAELVARQMQYDEMVNQIHEGLEQYIDDKAAFAKKLRKFRKKEEIETKEDK